MRINKDRERLRQRLDTSLLAQTFGRGGGWFRGLLLVLTWTTIVLAPLLLLALTQMAFLPYQSIFITEIQRALLLIDGVAVVFLWTAGIGSLVISCFPLVALAIPSWFVLVFPERPRSHFLFVDTAIEKYPALRGFVKRHLTGNADLVHRGATTWFSNRLVLPDQNLAAELGNDGATSNLRGRRLASAILDRADLRSVDFTGPDMRRASLVGAQMQKAKFECADTGRKQERTTYFRPDTPGTPGGKIETVTTTQEYPVNGCAW